MPPEPSASQNINISGSSFSNSSIAQAKGNIHQVRQVESENTTEHPQAADIIALLDHLKALLNDSSLPEDQKTKAIRGVETAKDQVNEAEPDKEYAAKGLEHAAKVLKQANETMSEGTSLWEKAEPILQKLLPIFGVALGILA
ncbi:hypothetical protein H6F75_25980 [Nodosilinea sp. FACHB-131]|uniref:hypothetical protein n=1 Tax=Cyanophyceae TaxID=3028117 RepID=UPI0016849512|nr:hypothetical protein [Nodosilinea sp. FACHB-131]MBD1876939.1 hypothetical protein [Nodosilinea sp. FACHB-131]